MILYHGSSVEVRKPDLKHSRPRLDFGAGFYATPIREQAEKRCAKFMRRGRAGIVSRYEFDESAAGLKILSFESYSDEWLSFVVSCRRGEDHSDWDLVTGGIADYKVFNTVELYCNGLIAKDEALMRLRNESAIRQYCFRTPKALRSLRFDKSFKLHDENVDAALLQSVIASFSDITLSALTKRWTYSSNW